MIYSLAFTLLFLFFNDFFFASRFLPRLNIASTSILQGTNVKYASNPESIVLQTELRENDLPISSRKEVESLSGK